MPQDNWYYRKGMSKNDKKWFDNWAENSNHSDVMGVFFALIGLVLLGVLYYLYSNRQDEEAVIAARNRIAAREADADLEGAVTVLTQGGEQEWYSSTAGINKPSPRRGSPRRK